MKRDKTIQYKPKPKSIRNTYLYKLIDRATINKLFENNYVGKYRITPQHGSNMLVYHIYKTTKNTETHLLSIEITETIFVKPFVVLTKKENNILTTFFLNNYKGKPLIVKEIF